MAKSCVRFTPRNKEFDYINIVKLEGCVKTFRQFLVVLYEAGEGGEVVSFLVLVPWRWNERQTLGPCCGLRLNTQASCDWRRVLKNH